MLPRRNKRKEEEAKSAKRRLKACRNETDWTRAGFRQQIADCGCTTGEAQNFATGSRCIKTPVHWCGARPDQDMEDRGIQRNDERKWCQLRAGAGIVAMSATYPLDMVRGRLTVQRSGKGAQYRGIVHATGLIVRHEGLRSLYKGWLPSVLGVIPYVGLNFAVYETLKDWLLKRNGLKDDQDLSVVTRLTCGAIAGSIGQTVAFPLDVVRRRLQVSGWHGASEITGDAAGGLSQTKGSAHYNGMMDCFVKTVREEGFQALFRGLMPNYLKVAPSIAIAFVSYEQCKKSLGVELRIGD